MTLLAGCLVGVFVAWEPPTSTIWLRLLALVAAHGASTCTVAAALLHAAYFGGDFGTPRHGISRAKREICRRAIGAGAEHLVALFSSPAWLGVPTASICRRVGELNQEEREVALLRIANVLDQIELFILCREEQRRPHLEELTECIDLAERLGALTLAVEVRQCREQLQSLGDLSAVPLDGRDYAGFLPPLSYRPGLRVRVFDVLRFAWRLLPRRLRDAARRPPATETASTVSFVVGSDRGVRRGNRAPGRIGP